MAELDTKKGWNSDVPKPRCGGGRTLKFGNGFRPGVKVKAKTTNLDDVVFQANLSSGKMLTQYRDRMDTRELALTPMPL